MPRIARVFLPGYIYHLTHRCHNGCFFLRFNKVRNEYRRRLRLAVRRHKIRMLDYCITSNHTHLLLMALQACSISVFMRRLEGEFGSHYNRTKRRHGAFWNGRFHATLIEGGPHLWNCMRYIDLNMVRAGVISHPIDWPWCGYQEIAGLRRRYRILALEELPRLAQFGEFRLFHEWYDIGLERTLRAGNLHRMPHWTESIAVGSEDYVRRIAALSRGRKRLEIKEWTSEGWYVREKGPRWTRLVRALRGTSKPARP